MTLTPLEKDILLSAVQAYNAQAIERCGLCQDKDFIDLARMWSARVSAIPALNQKIINAGLG